MQLLSANGSYLAFAGAAPSVVIVDNQRSGRIITQIFATYSASANTIGIPISQVHWWIYYPALRPDVTTIQHILSTLQLVATPWTQLESEIVRGYLEGGIANTIAAATARVAHKTVRKSRAAWARLGFGFNPFSPLRIGPAAIGRCACEWDSITETYVIVPKPAAPNKCVQMRNNLAKCEIPPTTCPSPFIPYVPDERDPVCDTIFHEGV